MKIPDIATPLLGILKKSYVFTLLHLKQSGLFVLCIFSGKKVMVNYFESSQQAAVNDVPLCFFWDANNYYKVSINGINVTFNKAPIFQSSNYSGRFVIVAYGIFSKQIVEINMEVKENYSEKKYKPVKFNYTQHTAEAYLGIESKLIHLKSAAFFPKGYKIKLSSNKHCTISIKEEHIIDNELLNSLRHININHQSNHVISE